MTSIHPPGPDILRWPGLAAPPPSPLRAGIAERLFRHAVRTLPVQVHLPGGQVLGAGGPDSPVMRVLRPTTFFHRIGLDSKIGFGESYMAGDWTSTRLADLLTPFARRMATLVPKPLQAFRRVVDHEQPQEEHNTVDGARENIHRHYDLSNELFATFLDETMTYSAAWFTPGSTDLAQAQRRKIDGILDYAGVRGGTRMLEIGTGWGELAIRAAQRGAEVTSLTLSGEQKSLAEQRISSAGVNDKVEVQLRDYRHAEGRYDAIVSVEMIEAVGREYWPIYFGALDRLLVPGGRIGLQAITMPHDRMLATRSTYTWIHKYVFPGGLLPSLRAIEDNLAPTSLRLVEQRSLGPHYAQTLREWQERFAERWKQVAELGFDSTFRRMWEFYLAYCEAGFRARYIDVWQLGITKTA
ncbi:cyclopropane-fatty-acyl-phospholipid synthase family protein [Allokutzneria sp. NRRL B-24872]|uniref:SAM-dependent methyltransferase n=1 Tax=Allokutzneria sp. NRRL B-24872 TaxID=1137961 RepID=UPI000A392DCB|nr:cyclopropane-fatty-acyl-phospholipid synthase family protein [Allokutzneria sp. NRRL B-24872]